MLASPVPSAMFLVTRNCSSRTPLVWKSEVALSQREVVLIERFRLCLSRRSRKWALMTHQNLLALLLSGKTLWNRWRQAYPDVQAFEPDLHEAQLHGWNLRGFDLHGADLTEANLQEADLREADLQEADLRHADLKRANLSDANLQKANLHGADVRGAILCRTNLKGGDLSNVDLRGADLRGADVKRAMFDHATFDEANGSLIELNQCLEAAGRKPEAVAAQQDTPAA